MVKRVLIVFFFSFVMISNVYADSYYENDLGVQMSEDEYNFICELFGDYYPDVITQDRYDLMKEKNIFGQDIITANDDNNISTQSFIETSYKKLTLSYACGDECAISAKLKWKIIPATKSYDLFGTYLSGTSEITDLYSAMRANGSLYTPVEYKINSVGAAATHKLPSSISASDTFSFDFSFFIEPRGRIYVSYQHAYKSLSLADSRKYNLSFAGYGNVFDFNESIRPYYDDMSGLDIVF